METNKLNWEFINQGSFNSFELSTLPLTLQYGGRKSFKTGAELRQAQVSYPDHFDCFGNIRVGLLNQF